MTDPEHERQIMAWRKARVARLTSEEGWLSLIGRFDLPEGEHRVGSDERFEVSLPADRSPAELGRLIRRGRSVQFAPAPGVPIGVRRALSSTSEPVTAAIELKSDDNGKPDRLIFGSLLLELMQRSDSFALRVRDTKSPARQTFSGIDYYPIEAQWRVVARLVAYQPEKRIDLVYETGDPRAYRSPGAAVFQWQGVEYRIDPVFDNDQPRLYILFADLTNRDETYGAGRFLYAPLPQNGEVILDFNQAFNPPCAFSPYAVCPLPPPQNRLALRVAAGEKRPQY
jgi:uncharacterized protein